MNDPFRSIFFLAFKMSRREITLKFVDEITENEESTWPNMGIFIFLRHEKNRGKARDLKFPAMIGVGDSARQFNVNLRSLYREERNSNKFTCERSNDFPFVDSLTFTSRKLPTPRLEGSATAFFGYSLWELIPEDRDILEDLWRAHLFYFLGFGKPQG